MANEEKKPTSPGHDEKPGEKPAEEPTIAAGHQRILDAGVEPRYARALVEAGYDTPEKVALANDNELVAVKGITAESLRAVRRLSIPAREQSDR